MLEPIEIIGLCAGACTTFSFFPQLLKVVSSHSTKDISLAMYSILCLGLVLWVIYGIERHSLSIVLANCVTFIFAFAILMIKLRRPAE